MADETTRVRISPADDYGTFEFDPTPTSDYGSQFDPELPIETVGRWQRIAAEYEAMQAELAREYAQYEARMEAHERATGRP